MKEKQTFPIPLWMRVFVSIEKDDEHYMTQMARHMGFDKATFYNIITGLKKRRLINVKKIGRNKYVSLTQDGIEAQIGLRRGLYRFLKEK